MNFHSTEPEDIRRIEAWVAMNVMGYHEKMGPDEWPHGVDEDGAMYARLPSYLTDANADFEVLRHVRETWEPDDYAAFVEAIIEDLGRESPGDYVIGDWTRAACIARSNT